MKKSDPFARSWLLGGVALALALFATSAAADPVHQVIRVVRITGQVRYSTDGGQNYKPSTVGDKYEAGTIIQTAEDATADIMLGDEGSLPYTAPPTTEVSLAAAGAGGGGGAGGEQATANMIRVFPLTTLQVDKLTVDRTGSDETSDTQLRLTTGQIFGNTKKLSAQSHYEIAIPTGVASIRGATFLGNASGEWGQVAGSTDLETIRNNQPPEGHHLNPKQIYNPATDQVSDMPDNVYQTLLGICNDLGRGSAPRSFEKKRDHTRYRIELLSGTAAQ